MIFSKYKIEHIDLAAGNVSFPHAEGPYYCVFWYKSVPLGERYFNSQDQLQEKLFWDKCLDSIWPAILFYHRLQNSNSNIQKVSAPNFSSIKEVCESVISRYHVEQVPAHCDLSVVICTKDRAPELRVCLQHLQLQKCKPAEIIVVDNCSSSDETKKIASEFNVRYIREERVGLDIARNRGAQEAKSSIIAYVDDDTTQDPYWTYRVHETFLNPAIDAMTGLVIAASLETEAEVIFEKYWPFNRGFLRKIYDNNFFNSTLKSGPPVWEIGAGANMAFRKEVFNQVGYFDERLDAGAAGCSGDSELWYRILAKGKTIEYNPLAVVQHKHRNSIEDLKHQLHSYMRGFTVAMLIQHHRFGHRGNLKHLFKVLPAYYLSLIRKGFPRYNFQYQTLFSEVSGIFSGLIYFWRHRKTESNIN